jgi:serine protease Do
LRPACLSSVLLLLTLAPALLWAQSEPADLDTRRNLRRTPVVEVFERNKDAVVNISSTYLVQVQSPMGFDSLFDQFFDLPRQDRVRQYTSVGSGFVLHEAGYIVTNAHVVARTTERRVIFGDGSTFEAQVVAMDQQLDLAVLKIRADRPLKRIDLGSSSDLMVGETVVAIGNPLGYQHTVTSGVISALDRTLRVSDQISFTGLIQTDASINPGNSGGPLLNILGELVGINTAIRADAQNIGFAIPIDQLRENLASLLDVERRYRFTLGLDVRHAHGAVAVTQVEPGSPAQRANLRGGDIITHIDNRPIKDDIDYHVSLIGREAGKAIQLRLMRDGQAVTTTLTPQPRPRPDGGRLLAQKLGLTAQPMTAQEARNLRLPDARGLVVTAVERGSPAHRVGIQRGDIIDHVGRHPVADLDDVGELLESVPSGQQVQLRVLRVTGRTLFRASAVVEAR